MITIENLTKYYGKNRAVNNISFTINDNEILGFLGPNGAGKSTTMNMISGYLPMTRGKISIFGNDIVTNPHAAKKCIGYLPELPPVYPDMKVREYLTFCAGIKGIPLSKRKSEIDRVLEKLRIVDVQKRLIRNLSKGYKQRVGFAQALLGNPKFLILDEPTVGLDPEQVKEVRNTILELKKDHSIIFSSHILSEVSAVCDRVVIINKGDIKAVDTIENLEKNLKVTQTLVIKVKGDAAKIKKLIKAVEGVRKIDSVTNVSEDVNTYRVVLNESQGKTPDEIRNAVMSALLAENMSISEIFMEKPNLEDLFIKLINQSQKKGSLKELVAEMEEASDETQKNEKEEKK